MGEKKTVSWTAEEVLYLTGTQSVFLNAGITMMTGYADVVFSNGKESFNYTFEVVSTYSEGLFFSTGSSTTFTKYTKTFPEDATQKDIIDSYEGIFQTESFGISIGELLSAGGGKTYAVDPATKQIDLTGWLGTSYTYSAGVGSPVFSVSLGAQITAYRAPNKASSNFSNHPEWFYNMSYGVKEK